MTISYEGNFARAIFRWKGGVLKAIWKEMLVYFFLFFVIRMLIQFAAGDNIVYFVQLFGSYVQAVPLAFLLGFFVTTVVFRWSRIVNNIPWPDDAMLLVNAHLSGDDDKVKLQRHTVARYLLLSQVLVFRDLSAKVRIRFPRLTEVANAGLMTLEEHQLHEACSCINIRWQLPLQWAINAVVAPSESITPEALLQIVNEINRYRNSLYNLHLYNWICIPLIYAQTVSAVVYGYLALCLLGHQYPLEAADPIIPFSTILQFVVYVGWLKVGQNLMRPFGDDDDDLEMNFFLDRHAMVAMSLAGCVQTPKEEPEMDDVDKILSLPYTKLSTSHAKNRPPKSHALIQLKNRHGLELWEKKTAAAPVLKDEEDERSPGLKEIQRRSMLF